VLLSELPDAGAAVRASACVPIQSFAALRATPFPFLLYQPILNAVLLQVVELIDQMLMVGNTILDVDVLEILQALTRKVGTFKTPSHSMLLGALAKAMAAFFAGGHHVVRMAAVTAYFFKSKACSLSPPFQLPDIIYLMGEIAGAIAAINAAYPNQFPVIFFHTTTYHGH
jgi:hypothetical protein